jgi:hypothetical protein
MNALEECHQQLADILGSDVEPMAVLRCAERHRAYWRPDRVRVVLLAESPGHTATPELRRWIVQPSLVQSGVPLEFVRLVYCLGYGENDILDKSIDYPRNSGTPQYWKVFYSCVNRVFTNGDFAAILKEGTRGADERIRNKLALLQQLKERGVWLLDASLVALYPKPTPGIVRDCLQVSWDAYVGQVVRTARPTHIVCLGKVVGNVLADRLRDLGIPFTVLAQPNARLSAAVYFDQCKKYYEIVQRGQL